MQKTQHKISAAQLFCILLLSRVTAEIVYPEKAGFGGTGLAAALTAEAIRFILALPVLIYSFRGRAFYAALWRKNRFLGWVSAIGAAAFLAGFTARTLIGSSEFVQRSMLNRTPELLIMAISAAAAAYAVIKGVEAISRAGVLFLAAAAVVSLLVILADIPYFDVSWKLPGWDTELFIASLIDRLTRSGEYLVFAALLPYVRTQGDNKAKTRSGAAGMWFALAGAAATGLLCVFLSAVLGEYHSMAEFPAVAAASLADIVLFKRLDGLVCGIWALCAVLRTGLLAFSAFSVIGECVKCAKEARYGKEAC